MLLGCCVVLFRGYHPGAEDDGVYLASIEHDLNPHLFQHDAAFFVLQSQATLFDQCIALSQRLTSIPLPWCILLWQVVAVSLLLLGCLRLARRCFTGRSAHWAAVVAVGVLSALSIAGTALYLLDEHLHPRTIATALILHAIVAVLDGELFACVGLLALALVFHPIMAAFGISFCVILGLQHRLPGILNPTVRCCCIGIPTWILAPTNADWWNAISTRRYYLLSRWTWYEQLGVIGPFFILLGLRALGRRRAKGQLGRLSHAALLYSAFQLAVALLIFSTPALARTLPWQPMRYLHLQYVLMIVLCFALLGERLLRNRPLYWLAVFLPLGAIMFRTERASYPATEHFEWPGRVSNNDWLQAFRWIRNNTPADAYFAIDPYYLRAPGEDYHGFRALAERSVLADSVKDAAVVTQVPGLAPAWKEQSQAQQGIDHFQAPDFARLHAKFGVTWVLLHHPADLNLPCPYEHDSLAVCELPNFPPTPGF